MKMFFKKNLILLSVFSTVALSLPVIADQSNFSETLIAELSSRHPQYTKDSLLKAAGSEDRLVGDLINLRNSSKPPMLGPRAEKLLIYFSNREDVKNALLEDVANDKSFGLGSVVLSSLPAVGDKSFRKELAKKAKSNHKSESNISKRYQEILKSLPADTLE